MECAVENCDRPAKTMGWCHAHYMRHWYTGDVQSDIPIGHKSGMGAPYRYYCDEIRNMQSESCSRWPFAYNERGRAIMKVDGKQVRVHRFACHERNGSPPSSSHHAAHSCGNAWCVNPNHIRWATPAENNQDKLSHGTHNRGERHNLVKLTEDEVQEIRRLTGHESIRELSRRFGISRWHVKSIQSHVAWSWLPERKAA